MREFVKSDSVQSSLDAGFHYNIDSLDQRPELNGISLAQLLNAQTGLYLKSNGPGLLSTPSFRGGDANHTAILWNGIKLNSPMHGTMDLSLVPINLFQSVDVFTGSSSNLYASGGVGGGIQLNNDPNLAKRDVQVGAGVGSFGYAHLQGALNLPFHVKQTKMVFSARLEASGAENTFDYLDIFTQPYERKVLQHGDWQRQNMLSTWTIAFKRPILVQLSGWLSQTKRNLPVPINLTQNSQQTQGDTSMRYQAMVKWMPRDGLSLTSVSYFEENINHYSDPRLSIDNTNRFTHLEQQFRMHWQFATHWKWSVLVNGQWLRAGSANYDQRREIITGSAVTKVERDLWSKRLLVEGGARAETYLDYNGLLPFAGLSVKPWQARTLAFIASYAQTLRLPTLNELYWSPGGNTELRPETGDILEAGFKWGQKATIKAVYFYGNYRDRIRWLPQGSVFAPINIAEAEVNGVDLHADLPFFWRGWDFTPFLNTSYTVSQGSLESGETSYSLSYVPEWSGSSGVAVERGALRLFYSHQFTGKRFITNDESAYMPSFHVGDFSISVVPTLRIKPEIRLTSTVQNVWDVNYQNLPWRPMPGRTFQFNLTVAW